MLNLKEICGCRSKDPQAMQIRMMKRGGGDGIDGRENDALLCRE
jgi:hypothetical protein